MANRTDTQSVINLVINGKQAMTSLKELTDTQRKLNAEIRNMKPGDPGYKKQLQEVQMVNKALDEQKKAIKGLNTDTSKLATGWKDIAGGLVAGFGIGFGLETLKNFGVQVFETTAKFQKLEAVLTTTLGTQSGAKLAMQQIQDFAAKTPFQVDELTQSYVKLANQGFKPTMGQMRQLGDLAASTGKSFDQLTEAMIDAQTGEFERLKEFGIRAEKNGDKVQFSFKGITKEVEFTNDAIRNYITSLGDAEGISGSMAGISETLSGKVSNLSDSWDSLLNTIGGETEGVFSGVFDTLGNAISMLNKYMSDLSLAQKYNTSDSGFWARAKGAYAQSVGGIDLGATGRSIFAGVSQNLDKQIGNATSYSRLNEIITDLNGRMKRLDRTTQDGAAAYQLYADKLKMVKDRAKEIGTDRDKAANIKKAEEAKKTAKETEKAQKEAEKKEKQLDKQQQKNYEKLKADIDKNAEEIYQNSLSKNDREVREVQVKYEALRAKAKGHKELIVQLQNQEGDEITLLMKKQKAEELEIEKKNQAEAEKIAKEKGEKIGKQLIDDAEFFYQNMTSEHQKEIDAVNDKYERLLEMAEQFGMDRMDIELMWANEINNIDNKKGKNGKKKLTKEEELQQYKEAAVQTAQIIADTSFSIAAEKRNAESNAKLTQLEQDRQRELENVEGNEAAKAEINAKYDEMQRAEKKRAWEANKKASINQALINGALAATNIWATTPKADFGLSTYIMLGLSAASTIASIASISAQEPPQFATGIRNFDGGTAVVGEAGQELIKEKDKWWLTDGPTMANLAPGTDVYNAKETAQMLGDTMYKKINYSLNSSTAKQAEQNYRSNGTAVGSGFTSSITTQNAEINALMGMVADLTQSVNQVNTKKVVFDFNTFENEQEKLDYARNQQTG